LIAPHFSGFISPMIETTSNTALVCPVKNCGERLSWEARRCACPRGHAFDVARSGYLNLLTPQDKRAKDPGDSKETVRARSRLLEKGLGAHILEALAAALSEREIRGGATALDVGCGDGYFLSSLAERFPLDGTGVDISSAAVDAAAKRSSRVLWIAANADRRLPFEDGSFDFIFSITSRKNAAEFDRLLRRDGLLVVAVPAEDDLVELREAVLGRALLRDREERTRELVGASFILQKSVSTRATVALDADGLRDLLATTYRGARGKEAAKATALDSMEVTVSAKLLCFAKADGRGDVHIGPSDDSGK
jgi:23S rRNA (guanine745-N1)-methyltransferase